MKINKIILFGIIVFIFGICNANADQLFCEYGTTDSDSSAYEKKLTLIYDLSYSRAMVDFANSPIFSEVRKNSNYSDVNYYYVSGQDYDYFWEEDSSGLTGSLSPDSAYLYLTDFLPVSNECPEKINYAAYTYKHSHYRDGHKITKRIYYDLFYVDKMDTALYIASDDNKSAEEEYSFSDVFYSKAALDSGKTVEEIDADNTCVTYKQHMDNIKAAIKKKNSCDSNPDFSNGYAELQDLCASYLATNFYQSGANECSTKCSLLYDDVAELCKDGSNRSYCGSLGNRMVNWLFKILNFIRYGLPPVAIILSILDYMKAIAADNEDEIKKVNGKIVKRLIAVALIFIFPFILNFILGIFDIPGLNASNPFCAK